MMPSYDPFTAIIFHWLLIFAWPVAIYFTLFFLLALVAAIAKKREIEWGFAIAFTIAAAAWCWLINGWILS